LSEAASFREKFLPGLDAAVEVADNLRRAGRRVVFTNGCFDILHVGHVRSLEDARTLGDFLFVGINSDKSTRALKGQGRPLTPENERAEILAALSAVDFVFVFDGETADDVILALRPDVHAKGTDYTEETVPERESVLSYGGEIRIVGDPKGHSTRDILGRLKA